LNQGDGKFFTTEIDIDATTKAWKFISTIGDENDATPGTASDGQLRVAGTGIKGQALYSFFKFAWKEVPRLPQFPFPMLSITNEQFEFINGWYIDETPITQKLVIGSDVRQGVTVTSAFTASVDGATETLTTADTTVDLRKFQENDGTFSTTVEFVGGTNGGVGALTFTAISASSFTTSTDLAAATDEATTLTGDFTVITSDLIRTAGYTVRDQSEALGGNDTYTQLTYAGVITLGSLVDQVDQPYYIQENTATAFTTNATYTRAANQPVVVKKVANASASGGATGGNDRSDIGFRTIGTQPSTPSGLLFFNSASAGANRIQAADATAFSNVQVGDIVRITGITAGGGANNRVYTVEELNPGGTTDTLVVSENITTDITVADASAVITVLDSVSAVNTNLNIFTENDLITIADAVNGANNGTFRTLTREFAASANTALLGVGNVPIATRLIFEPTISTFATETAAPASLTMDYTSFFKIFVRERGKSYAESSVNDIGVTEITYIVYRFPVTNANDININTSVDTDISSTDADQTAPEPSGGDGADQTFFGGDFSKIQIYYLRNPFLGTDNLNITGDYNTSTTYAVGDIAREGSTIGGRWYYLSNDQGVTQTSITGAGGDNDQNRNVFTQTTGNTITFDPAANTIVIGNDNNLTTAGTFNMQNGDWITVGGTNNRTNGNTFQIGTIAFSSPNTTITLDLSNGGAALKDFAGSLATYNGVDGDTTLQRNIAWTPWVKTSPPPSLGGLSAADEAINGGERLIDTGAGETFYAFDTIIDSDDTLAATDSPYLNGSTTNGTTAVYEFAQWALRRPSYLNESTSGLDQYQKYGKIADQLLDFVGSDLVTRDGVFIDDMLDTFQNSLIFTDWEGTGNIVYPTVVACSLRFNNNLAADSDSVFFLYYTTLSVTSEPAGSYDFGNINAKQVYRADGLIVGQDGSVNNKINNTTAEGNEYVYNFNYGYSEDTADPGGTGEGFKAVDTPVDVVAIAIGLGNGVYVQQNGQITDSGLTLTLVAPLERNYINP